MKKLANFSTWLNTMVTYRHALKLYVATIQGHPVFEGGIYYYLVSIFKNHSTGVCFIRMLYNSPYRTPWPGQLI